MKLVYRVDGVKSTEYNVMVHLQSNKSVQVLFFVRVESGSLVDLFF